MFVFALSAMAQERTVTGRHRSRTGAMPADYARQAAERLGFTVRITEFAKSADRFGRAPGVLLVDPDFLAGGGGSGDIDMTIAELPSWVLPVIVGDQATGPPSGHTRTFLEKSHRSYRRKPEIARRGLRGVSLLEFVALMPFLVTHAEREYLRHGPIQRWAARPGFRPRLADSSKPTESPVKENPDV